MRMRVVSSKDEIGSLDKSEKIVHLAFRPSNKDIFALVQACPNVKAIHIPGSYMKTVSDSTKMFLIGHRLRPPFLSKSLSIDMRV